jgi:hypothetical protein
MLRIASLVAALASAIILTASRVDAQSWYPKQCTTIDLCATVDNVAWAVPANGTMPHLFVSSRNGKAIVNRTFPVGQSRDEHMHVCMRYDPFGDLEVTCLLVPVRAS